MHIIHKIKTYMMHKSTYNYMYIYNINIMWYDNNLKHYYSHDTIHDNNQKH